MFDWIRSWMRSGFRSTKLPPMKYPDPATEIDTEVAKFWAETETVTDPDAARVAFKEFATKMYYAGRRSVGAGTP